MADIPLKPEDEMTNDLVGAVENIAQSVKAGSRDFTKSFTGLTTAIKRLQTTLVNAIKAIKIQVVAKPEKVQKPAIKDKSTSTKEVVKEKETKTEVAPEKKAKTPKVEAAKTDVPKQPKAPKVVDPIEAAEKENKKKRAEESSELLLQTRRTNAQLAALRLQNAMNPPPKAPPKEKPKPVDPQEKERVAKEKAREKEIQKRQEKVKPVKISSLIEGINQAGDAWSKMISGVRQSIIDNEKIVKADEKQVEKTGKEGTKDFVGPPKKLFENDEKATADSAEKAIADAKKAQDKKDAADAKAISDAKKVQDKKDAADAKAIADEAAKASKEKEKADREASSAEKTLRTYFRKQEERQANEEAKAANDLVKQQEQAAKELAQANQRTQKELDSMIAGFQGLSALFRGPLVNYGLKMIAKGVGYKQPKEMSKGGDVSYLADGGDASSPMKPKGTDTQPAMLTPGEFVVNKDASQDPENKKQLESINSGKKIKKPEYHNPGGIVAGAAIAGVAAAETTAVVGGAVTEAATVAAAEAAAAAAETTAVAAGTAADAAGTAASAASTTATSASTVPPALPPALPPAPPNNINPPSSASSNSPQGGGGGNAGNILKKIDFDSFGKKLKDLTGKFPSVGIASTALGVALNSVVHSVKIASQALAVFGPMVAKANPALMQKLEIVMNDLSGVIGRALIPAVEYLSPLFRKYADYVDYSMKKLTPSINKSAVAFDNVVSPLMDLGAVVYSVIGPVFNALATIVVGVSNVLKPIIEFVTAFSSALVQVIGVLGSPIVSVAMATLSFAFGALTFVIKTTLEIIQTLLGAFVNIVGLIIQGLGKVISYIPFMGNVGKSIAKGGEAISKSGENLKRGKPAEQDRIKKGSSVGAAVREVSSTSIAGVGDEVRKNAMMAASGQKTQEDMLGDISTKLDKNALADAFAEGIKKAGDNKPQRTPPVTIQGKIPGALTKEEQVELGTV